MPVVLSHRGNVAGPCPATENRLPSVEAALKRGWGIETDIRRDRTGRYYIAHDRQPSGQGLYAEAFCALFRDYPYAPIALNIKELGGESALLEFLAGQAVLDQVCLFDMELLEPIAGVTARTYRALDPSVRIAARVSDRGESIDRALSIEVASTIWLDEFDGPWSTAADVRRLQHAGRLVYAVSPDLHGAPFHAARERWLQFIDWGVDGICTDYPAALDALLAESGQKSAA